MAAQVELRGLQDLAHLSRALREAGEQGKGLRKELYAGLNRATKPIRKDLKDEVAPSLPHGGGLAGLVEKQTRFATSTRVGRDIGVRIVARGRRRRTLQQATQQGRFRHPVFADGEKPRKEWTWVDQTAGVRKGLLGQKFEQDKPKAREEVLIAIEQTKRKIDRSI
jgi:hypothetical protein